MILVDHVIRDRVSTGELAIGNFDERSVQPASYDLRLGNLIFSPAQPEKPIDLLNGGGGAWRLPPYGTALVTTDESLRLPKNVLGRIGLKSSLARVGLFASTGPQIDPGFEGKLFVSIFNITAAPHILKYRDTFLTIEFHQLDTLPEHGYAGPYQGRQTIGPEIMDSLARLEGLTLSQMQRQFSELAKHVERWSEMAGRVDELISAMHENSRAIQQSVSQKADSRVVPDSEVEIIPPRREISAMDAADEIVMLFKKRKRLYYSDIAELLSIDLSTVIKACQLLEKRGVIEGASNVSTRTKKTRR